MHFQAAILCQQVDPLRDALRKHAGFLIGRSLQASNPDDSDAYTAIAEAADSVVDSFPSCTAPDAAPAFLLCQQARLLLQSLAVITGLMRTAALAAADAWTLAYADAAAEFVQTFGCLQPQNDDCSSISSASSASSFYAGSCHTSTPSTTFSDAAPAAVDRDGEVDGFTAAVLSCAASAGQQLPVLNPYGKPPSDAKLLQKPSDLSNVSVWRFTQPASVMVLKVVPFHSPEAAARVHEEEEESGGVGSDCDVAEARSEEDARREPLMAAAVNRSNVLYEAAAAAHGGASCCLSSSSPVPVTPVRHEIFVSPEFMAVQDCPLVGGEEDGGHDLQLVVGYRYCAGGNAAEYLRRKARQAVREVVAAEGEVAAAAACPLPPGAAERIAEALAREVNGLALSVFGKMDRMHELGFVINDLKLENIVYDTDGTGFRFIDAEAVRRCPLGQKVPGASKHTEEYAAPEQKLAQGPWSDSFSDVYAGGASMKEAMSICLDVCWPALRCDQAAFSAVRDAFLSRIGPLHSVMEGCTAPEGRPSAAAVLQELRRQEQQQQGGQWQWQL